jgi:transcriptional regulator with XRE-family HTH domain
MLARIKIREKEERRRIGRRIRRRRLFLGQTQTALARFLGVTFQQVQKYETGLGRVPPQRLYQIAHYLEVTPDYFSSPNAEQADAFEHFVQSPEGIALYRAMALIGDAQIRARLILAIAALSDSLARPEEDDAGLISHWLRQIASQRDHDRHNKTVRATIHAMKVELAQLVGKTLKARKLTQKFAARILVTDQARISALASGNVDAASFEKLLRYLVLLGWNARIAIARRPLHARGKIELTSNSES